MCHDFACLVRDWSTIGNMPLIFEMKRLEKMNGPDLSRFLLRRRPNDHPRAPPRATPPMLLARGCPTDACGCLRVVEEHSILEDK
jgi:hypothetical protein